jgi:enoyl-CoA hydratase/carnithine racemase
MTNSIKLEQHDGIATLYLDRPPVNAIDTDLIRSLAEGLSQIEGAGNVRALVVTGVGTCFSAGLDLKAVPRYTLAEQRDMLNTLNGTVGRLYSLPIPTVAAINGHAIAGGLVLALACDYRVGPTTGSCQLGLTEARAGIPFPAAAMAIVQAELTPAVARRTTLVARNIGPEAALVSGILDEVQPPDQVLSRAHAVAHDLGTIPRTAYARIKRQLRAPAIAYIERTLSAGNDPMLESWLSAETQAAAASLLAGDRKP